MQNCPECESPLEFDPDEAEEGDIIPCDECGAEYEVVAVDPLELARVDDAELDEEDDEDFAADEEEE